MNSSDLEVYAEPEQSATLFRTDDPAEVVARASAVATELAAVIEARKLYKMIGTSKHVLVEGWTLLGSMLGVFPICEWTRPLDDESGWEARVEARTREGALIGAAESMCDRTETKWAAKPSFELRGMAQTRATSRTLRQPLGFVMRLAGYEATPAEEMDVAPANQPLATPAEARSPVVEYVTPAQLKNLHAHVTALEKKGQDRDALKQAIYDEYGVTSTKELTKKQASEIIDKLGNMIGGEIPF